MSEKELVAEIASLKRKVADELAENVKLRKEASNREGYILTLHNGSEITRLRAAETEAEAEIEGIKAKAERDLHYAGRRADRAETNAHALKEKIAELENLLAIDSMRLTQAWRQIEELKKGKQNATV